MMTNKERIERIKKNHEWGRGNYMVGPVNSWDIDWLIEQAERVQEQEKTFEILYHQYASQVKHFRDINQRYKKALEFYVDEDKWIKEDKGLPYMPDYHMEIESDMGEKARQALEGDSQ